MDTDRPPTWIRVSLLAAAGYNLVWGTVVVLLPGLYFSLLGMQQPTYPQIWQCIGMIVGVFGIGYAIAAFNPARHWPIVLVGLLGKILGPIGFAWGAQTGSLPWAFGLTIITNDLIWLPLFVGILLHAVQTNRAAGQQANRGLTYDEALEQARDQHRESLASLSHRGPVLAVFLRHLGCTFCREALADLAKQRREIELGGASLVLIHMASEEQARDLFQRYCLGDVSRISDPQRRLYRALRLRRGSLRQLLGLRVWMRGMQATLAGHFVGKLAGDGLQMPGAFLIHRGKILQAYRHKHAGDRPDYQAIACGTGACDRAGSAFTGTLSPRAQTT